MYCGECGAKLKKNAEFCGECGAKVHQKEEEEKKPKKVVKKTERKPMSKKKKAINSAQWGQNSSAQCVAKWLLTLTSRKWGKSTSWVLK